MNAHEMTKSSKDDRRHRYVPISAFGNGTIVRLRNMTAVVSNYEVFARYVDGTSSVCAPVLKGDTYGIGSAKIAPLLYSAGARSFFVEDCIEGVELRLSLPMSEAQIFIMGGLLAGQEHEFKKFNLIPCVNSLEQLRRWLSCSAPHDGRLPLALHFDSGMNRLGIPFEDIEELELLAPEIDKRCAVVLYMSHLANIKGDDFTMSLRQLTRFGDLINGLPPRPMSISCTDGVTLLPNEDYNCDLVRIGVGLIGGAPSANRVLPGLQPALEMYARVSLVRWVSEGESIGYGARFSTRRKTRIALVHIGYKDGYLRSLSRTDLSPNGGWMAIGGYRTPIVGLISHGLTTVDVTEVPDEILTRYQYAEVIGPNVDMRKIADLGGCYEVMASLGRHNPRVADYSVEEFEERFAHD